jgi:ABC-2 type transport system permease protein
MNAAIVAAVTVRVLRQLRRDRRTAAMLLVLPCVLITLLWWVYDGQELVFDRVGAPLLAVFPFIVMFLVTSVTTLSERTSGTLERLLAMPMGKLDFLAGYALAFGAVAIVQGLLTTSLALFVLGLDVAGPAWVLAAVAMLDGVLGTTLGLFVSAFARTEFQAVQFMPAFVLPQLLVCGLLLPRDQLPDALRVASDLLPLSYAVDAMQQVSMHAEWTTDLGRDVVVLVGFIGGALLLGAATLRRRTP